MACARIGGWIGCFAISGSPATSATGAGSGDGVRVGVVTKNQTVAMQLML